MGAVAEPCVESGRWTRSGRAVAFLAAIAAGVVGAFDAAEAARQRVHEATGFQLFESPQVDPIVLDPVGGRLYVVSTTSNRVHSLDPANPLFGFVIEVGQDPASLAIRPGAGELWVSNHVSDTVSIIDIAAGSPTLNTVIDTIQAIDADGVTTFDEPLGIAFTPDGATAYVALSSRNQVAVIDAATRTITTRLNIRAQEPRALAVRNGLLYVAAFEGGNQSETGACQTENNANPQCTLGQGDLTAFATNPNLPGEAKNIVIDAANPDRDLFVFRTDTNAEVAAVTGVGTLLYGLTVNAAGRVFITQTDARNHVNGIVAPAGSRQDVNADGSVNLRDLANRMFTNEIAATTCTTAGCGAVTVTDLEGASPTPATALATPYAIGMPADESVLIATSMGSSRVFAVNPATMAILSRVDLGSVGGGDFGQQLPRGVAVQSTEGGAPHRAFVLNSGDGSVSVLDISNPSAIAEIAQYPVGTSAAPAEVQRGRVAFNSAFASSNGTFSCGSCHPDGNTDQLMWRIGGECFLGGCVAGEDEPRSTMPIRGLKNTLPLHWDGTLGDPFGGGNGAVGNGGAGGTDCSLGGADGDHDCFRDLVNGSLSGVMCEQTPSCATGPSGLPGPLTEQEREDMAFFLASVSYSPARGRRIDDTLSTPGDPVPVPNGDGTPSASVANAFTGFQDFFTNQGGLVNDPDTCADSTAGCHVLPLTAGTNSSTLQGFDVPTMRGMTDRFLQFSLGITNVRDILLLANAGTSFPPANPLEAPIQFSTTQGYREITTFGSAFTLFQPVYGSRPLHMFQMFEEASTGYSGAQARQVALNERTTGAGQIAQTETLMSALELADARGLVNLRATGVRDTGAGFAPILLSYRSADATWKNAAETISLTHAQLVAEATAGDAILTLHGALRSRMGGAEGRQPVLGPCVAGCSNTTGDPSLPNFSSGGAANPPAFTVTGTDVRVDATPIVDGQPVTGTITCGAGATGSYCNPGNVSIDLDVKPATGLHLVQVLNPQGPQSNELPLCVGTNTNCN
jgi:YVTN family beta-propeller protein